MSMSMADAHRVVAAEAEALTPLKRAFLAAKRRFTVRALMTAGFTADEAAQAILFCVSVGPLAFSVSIKPMRRRSTQKNIFQKRRRS